MKRKTETVIALVLLVAAMTWAACEISQVSPTAPPIEITISQPAAGSGTEEPPGEGPSGTITLEPQAVTVAVGSNVNVKVVVRDENGQEIPSVNISVNIVDKTILELAEIDGRILAFRGASAGTTSVIVSASGLQTSLAATVTP